MHAQRIHLFLCLVFFWHILQIGQVAVDESCGGFAVIVNARIVSSLKLATHHRRAGFGLKDSGKIEAIK